MAWRMSQQGEQTIRVSSEPPPLVTALVQEEWDEISSPIGGLEPDSLPVSSRNEEESDPLLDLLPRWLRETGELRREEIEVEGQQVDRVRVRHAGVDGVGIEIEVSDFGQSPTEDQFKSLGFDVNLEEMEADGEIQSFEDGENYLVNWEYSEADQSGALQMVAGGRYMMEIHLESVAAEAFQDFEDREGLFAKLLEQVGGE